MRWAAAATVLFAAGLAAHLAHGPAWLAWTFFLACYAAGGWEPGLAGLRALRDRALDVDLLMVAAAIGAAAVGQVLDGGLLIVIFATSGALEAVATHRTAQAVRGLLGLAPDRAVRLVADGTEEPVDAASLDAGDVILVRPGERIAADGQVLDGRSDVDQATITGEPLPAPKQPGDEVFAGTLNGAGRADRPGRPGRRRQRDRPDRGHGGRRRQGPRPAPSCSSRRSSSATPSAWSPPRCCCSRSRCSPARHSRHRCCAR